MRTSRSILGLAILALLALGVLGYAIRGTLPSAANGNRNAKVNGDGLTSIKLHVVELGKGDTSVLSNTGIKIIGCGDRIAVIDRRVPRNLATIRGALTQLFALGDLRSDSSGYYNALSNSKLQVDDVVIDNSTATVALSGTITLGGTCDVPRVIEQIEQTIEQFSGVLDARVTLNGKPLQAAISTRDN